MLSWIDEFLVRIRQSSCQWCQWWQWIYGDVDFANHHDDDVGDDNDHDDDDDGGDENNNGDGNIVHNDVDDIIMSQWCWAGWMDGWVLQMQNKVILKLQIQIVLGLQIQIEIFWPAYAGLNWRTMGPSATCQTASTQT